MPDKLCIERQVSRLILINDRAAGYGDPALLMKALHGGHFKMKAGDVMTIGAATVRPDASLAQAAQLLIEHHISGLPVVDQDGRLIGLVTEHDFLRQHDGTRRRWLDALLARPGGQITARELYDRRVVNVMSRGPISVRVDAPIEEIVDLMHRHRVKRLPVVAKDKVVGIVSRADLVEALLGLNECKQRS